MPGTPAAPTTPPALTTGTLHSPASLLLSYTTDLSCLQPSPVAGQGEGHGLGDSVLVGEALCTCCSHTSSLVASCLASSLSAVAAASLPGREQSPALPLSPTCTQPGQAMRSSSRGRLGPTHLYLGSHHLCSH